MYLHIVYDLVFNTITFNTENVSKILKIQHFDTETVKTCSEALLRRCRIKFA